MKKSLLISYFFPPKLGGIENYLRNLCLNLPADKIVVLTEPADKAEKIDKDLPFKVIRKKLFPWPLIKPSWLPLLFPLIKIIKKEQIDLLQFGHYSNLVTLGLIVRKLYGKPYYVYTHGVDTLLPRKNFLQKKLMAINLKNAEWIIANSQFMRDKLVKFGILSSKVLVVYPSLPSANFNNQIDLKFLKEKYNLDDKRVIITLARLVQRKGQDMVIKSLPQVLAVFPKLCYLIVGDGPDQERLKNLVSDLKLENHVVFVGPIEDKIELKLPFYRMADLFIMPARELDDEKNVESFGIVYLEAQAAGCPVITGRTGGSKETIVAGETGFSVDGTSVNDISQTIIELLSDDKLRLKMGEKAKQWVSGAFNWPTQIKKVIYLLEKPLVRKKYQDQPAISVIIPAYQVASTIKACLISIFNQTFSDFEVIVVNDGSTDNLKKELKYFEDKVKILNQENRGAAAARNTGAREAKGKYLFFCDADVILKPEILEKMTRILELNHSASFCYCAFRFGWRSFSVLPYSKVRLKKYNYISTMSLLRKDDFPGFDERLKRFQDWDLWLTLAEKNKFGLAIEETLFEAPLRREGISRRVSKKTALAEIINKHHL